MKKKKQKQKKIRFTKDNDYKELSNFYPSIFIAVGRFGARVYPDVEHYFQAEKTKDRKEYEYICEAPTPYQAKKRGRECMLVPKWEKIKEKVMLRALVAKFTQNLNCRQTLLSTKEAFLIEQAPWDGYWGSGRDGNGRNRLGEMLMELRSVFHKEVEKTVRAFLADQQRIMREIKNTPKPKPKKKKFLAEMR